jgi:hypothetical protein
MLDRLVTALGAPIFPPAPQKDATTEKAGDGRPKGPRAFGVRLRALAKRDCAA